MVCGFDALGVAGDGMEEFEHESKKAGATKSTVPPSKTLLKNSFLSIVIELNGEIFFINENGLFAKNFDGRKGFGENLCCKHVQ